MMAQPTSSTSTSKKYAIVTGANAGIGKEITAGLMHTGAHVVMGCRNMEACEVARAELQKRDLPGTCECCRLDLGDPRSIRAFAAEQADKLQRHNRPLDILVNNAGILGDCNTTTSTTTTSSSPPYTNQCLLINHLRPFLLTGLLLPSMTSGSRVVNVSSRAHFACKSFEVVDNKIVPGAGGWFPQYAGSKLCNILHARELQDRYQTRGIVATSVSPGFVNTTIFRSLPGSLGWLAKQVAPWLGKTPEQGAAVAVFAATSPTLSADSPVPLLLHNNKPMQPSALAQDKKLAQDLWTASCAAVGWSDDS